MSRFDTKPLDQIHGVPSCLTPCTVLLFPLSSSSAYSFLYLMVHLKFLATFVWPRLLAFNISLILLYFHPLPHPCTHISTPSDYTISAGEESSHPSPHHVPTLFANTTGLFSQVCFFFQDQRHWTHAQHLQKPPSAAVLDPRDNTISMERD